LAFTKLVGGLADLIQPLLTFAPILDTDAMYSLVAN